MRLQVSHPDLISGGIWRLIRNTVPYQVPCFSVKLYEGGSLCAGSIAPFSSGSVHFAIGEVDSVIGEPSTSFTQGIECDVRG